MGDTNELISAVIVFMLVVFLVIPLLSRLIGSSKHDEDKEDKPQADRIAVLLHDLARADKTRAGEVAARLVTMGPDVMERLFLALEHADFRPGLPGGDRSRRALEELIAAFGSQAIPRAKALLNHPFNPDLQETGRRILKDIGQQAIAPLLESGTKQDILAILEILENSGEPGMEALLHELGRNDETDQNIAALLLKLGGKVVPVLTKALEKTKDPDKRRELLAIVEFLSSPGPTDVPA